MRHYASAGREYDKKSGFACPDARGGKMRSACHRYIPETKTAAPEADVGRAAARAEEDFTGVEAKSRWWSAPD